MTIKLIASDMDGTFLTENDIYSQGRFERILDNLRTREIRFVAASGRQVKNLQELFLPTIDKGYEMDFVGSNGAMVATLQEQLYSVHLSFDQLQKVIDWNARNPESAENIIIMTGEEATYVSNHATGPVAEMVFQFYPNVKQVEKLMLVDDRILEVTFVWPNNEVQQHVAALREVFGAELHATGSGFGSVDVLGKGVDKATGLQVLQDYYDVLDDEVMTFGDNSNDLEMLKKYKNGFVMPNAEDFMLAAIPNKALNTNVNDGVLETIEMYLGI
ncbi:HAD-IIB family hydrolase [Leuconostoc carnosum]|uniref:HAD superfamily hydrolase n=2 Tax=Leuconostoc carnosum TaxID=1252 RepID=K0DBC2_LEUCJ|nr:MULTISPECIES: HAD-IIB family hydrolase [Leuconostoc]AFT81216.1 HAD superfamily hydrolase [Leuconostoc carnosum JB16]KAA8326551.1 HAD-IIB family hydrolase [Leuconostoc carnosum]KAA8330548.1 HAD-IIB family hydrolase [Leuconostoc carnosum]KAA8362110.1 HAD-IIB family hydrolase [Leuconostoc carnosum]KAA8366659.1 HAD-IIB family hydrolase [Leuconostoc carnosum]